MLNILSKTNLESTIIPRALFLINFFNYGLFIRITNKHYFRIVEEYI